MNQTLFYKLAVHCELQTVPKPINRFSLDYISPDISFFFSFFIFPVSFFSSNKKLLLLLLSSNKERNGTRNVKKRESGDGRWPCPSHFFWCPNPNPAVRSFCPLCVSWPKGGDVDFDTTAAIVLFSLDSKPGYYGHQNPYSLCLVPFPSTGRTWILQDFQTEKAGDDDDDDDNNDMLQAFLVSSLHNLFLDFFIHEIWMKHETMLLVMLLYELWFFFADTSKWNERVKQKTCAPVLLLSCPFFYKKGRLWRYERFVFSFHSNYF